MALYKNKSRLLLTTCVNWSENYAYICVAHFQNVTDFFRVSGERERFLARNFVRPSFACDILEMKHKYKYFFR